MGRVDTEESMRYAPLAADRRTDDDGLPGNCYGGVPHQFDGFECVVCGAYPLEPDDDRPAGWYAPEPYPGHVCFDDCRHRRRR